MESDYNKLKAEKITLQKGLIKEREEKQKLQERVEELEASCKRKTEEVEALQLCNQQLVHKCETLQDKSHEKASNWGMGWFHTGGKNKKAIESIKILEEELQNKIHENEQVHIKNFEQRHKYKSKMQDIKSKLKNSEEYLRNTAEKMESMAIEILQYQSSVQSLFKEKKEYSDLLDTKNKEIQDSHNYFLKITNELKQKITYLQGKLRSVVSLDLSDYENYAVFNAPKFNRSFQFKQNEWLGKIWQSLENSLPIIKPLLQAYCLRLDALYCNSNPSCQKIVSEITQYSDRLYETYSQVIKHITDKDQVNSLIVTSLGKLETSIVYFFRLLKLEISKEHAIVQDFDKVSNVNKCLSSYLDKIAILLSRGISFIICSAYTKHNLWTKMQEISKSLTSTIIEAGKALSERLLLDQTIKYKINVKDAQGINDDLLTEIQNLTGLLNRVCSEVMQLKPNFYYSLNPLCQFTSKYLSGLREISGTPGIPYSESLENVERLGLNDIKIKEQAQNIGNLEKNNANLIREIEKYKAEITKIENELAAVEQNLERKAIESGSGILHEHETISEDVKSGAQRFALRLTDSNGEPIPISTLSANNDLYLKIQELAINKINELAEQIKKTNRY